MNNVTNADVVIDFATDMWYTFATSSIGQWNMLEAYLSGACFTVFILFFRILDQIPSMNKYRLSPGTKPLSLFQPGPKSNWVSLYHWAPLVLYLATIHVFHFFYPKPLPDITAPSLFRVLFELCSGVVAYDFIFFWLHYAMHVFPILSFMNHHVHHSQRTMCSSEVQHHSVWDGTFQVLVNVFVQRMHSPFGAKHYLSRLLHNVLITYMLTEIHAGYNCWWSMHRLFPRLIGGSRRHDLHHKNGKSGNYQQFFMYLDDWMGTSFEDNEGIKVYALLFITSEMNEVR